MALKLSLKPGERVAINGAVIANMDRRASIEIENEARILREADIMQPGEVTTPAARIYFPVMMMYLEPSKRSDFHQEFASRLTQFMSAVDDTDCHSLCLSIAAHVANNAYYKALNECRQLMAWEEKVLAHVV